MSKQSNTKQINVPDGFMADARGRLVPLDLVKPVDVDRDKLVNAIMAEALVVQGSLQAFQADAKNKIEAFVERAAKKYQTSLGGQKGNVQLVSYDGMYKVQITIGTDIYFNEQLNVAKKLIDECIETWSQGANQNLIAVIDLAFETNSDGNAIPSRILGLKKLNIKDTKWKRAMRALNESQQVGSKKPYLRLYKKDQHGEFKQVAMDMAKITDMETKNAA